MNRNLILWLSTGVLTPLLYLLTKPLHVSKSGLYSLVLTYCAMLGSGQLVLGQDCTTCQEGRLNNAYSAVGCKCANAESTDCELLPDLIVSGSAAYSDNYETQGQLHIRTSIANIGYGPFIVYNTGQTVVEDGVTKQIAHQVTYHKNDDTDNGMVYNDVQEMDDIYMSYHPGHGHLHLENWVEMSIRIRPPGNNDPETWEIIGEGKKLSFYIVNDDEDCIGSNVCTDMTTEQNITGIDNPNFNFWGNPSPDLPLSPYLVNECADFPNKSIGGVGLGNNITQLQPILPNVTSATQLKQRINVISPGSMDVYDSETAGNYIQLPTDICNGQYYVVLKTNPDGLFRESNINNNIAVIPITLETQNTVSATISSQNAPTICGTSGSVSFTANTNVPDPTYTWSNGTSNSQISISAPSSTPTYTVTVSSSACGSATATVNAPVALGATAGDIATATITANQTICAGSSIDLLATGGTHYSWSLQPGLSAYNIANPTANPTETTTYEVTIWDDNDHCTNKQVTITVINPKVWLSGGSPIADNFDYMRVCDGGTLDIDLESDDSNIVYFWKCQAVGTSNNITYDDQDFVSESGVLINATAHDYNTAGSSYFAVGTSGHIHHTLFLNLLTANSNFAKVDYLITPVYNDGTNTCVLPNIVVRVWIGKTKPTTSVSVTPTSENCITHLLFNKQPAFSGDLNWQVTNISSSVIANQAGLSQFTSDIIPNQFEQDVTNASTTDQTIDYLLTFTGANAVTGGIAESFVGGAAPANVIGQSVLLPTFSCPSAPYPVSVTIPSYLNFNGSYMVGTTPTLGTIVGDTETWDASGGLRLNAHVTVPTGKTLLIQNTTIDMLDLSNQITVEKGAKLVVQNSTIKGGLCNQAGIWAGIRVIGTPTANHPGSGFDPYTMLNANHGIAILNGATIRNAKVGVASCTTTTDTNNYFDATTSGGLILTTNNTLFEDNEIGVFFSKFNQLNISRIYTTTFNTLNGFGGTINLLKNADGTPLGMPVGVAVLKNKMSRAFTQNTFNCTNTSTPLIQRGMGILNYGSQLNIGSDDLTDGNQFTNLYKGIDYYGSPSLNSQVKIKGNLFTNTQANITLTGGLLAQIKQNNIGSLPSSLPNYPAYGIFIDGTAGFSLHQNTINGTNPNAFGLVVKNTGSYAAEITENQFMGNLNVANLYLNKNTNLTIDCNQYAANIDWALLGNNLITGSDGFLEPQGECDPLYPQKARRNMFHTSQPSNPNNLHIMNLNTQEVYYRSYPGFKPDLLSGSADIDVCEDVLGDSQCSAFFGLDYCNPDDILAALISNSTMGDKARLAEYTKLLYARLCQDQTEQAKTDLNTEARDASYKVLTATYTDENDTLRALEALSRLPLDNPDNADFYNLFMQLLSATGSGKNTPNYINITSAAKQNDRVLQPIAQSIVATNNLSVFDKQIPTLPISRNSTTATDNNFRLSPNPTNSIVQVQLQQMPTNAYVQLYNIQGSLLYSTPIAQQAIDINTSSYPTGIYYCKLIDNGNTIATQKLIIIR